MASRGRITYCFELHGVSLGVIGRIGALHDRLNASVGSLDLGQTAVQSGLQLKREMSIRLGWVGHRNHKEGGLFTNVSIDLTLMIASATSSTSVESLSRVTFSFCGIPQKKQPSVAKCLVRQ